MEGAESEKQCARKVRPVLERHHLLLVTLLIVNTSANEALPIFLDEQVPEGISIVLSVTCVLMFGEIIPSAIFTGPNQLRIAAALTPGVKVLIAIVFPIAYSISKLLDCSTNSTHSSVLLSPNTLRKQPLLKPEPDPELDLEIATPNQRKHRRQQALASGTRLIVDEIIIIHGTLDLLSKMVTEVMIPMSKIYMLEIDTKRNHNTMADILASGHSRIPVYETRRSNIVGLLFVKKLIVLDPDDARPTRDLVLRKPILVAPNGSCYSMLNEKGRSHIALVTKDKEIVAWCWSS
ncbi:hypothetical protein PHMEG_0002267 [Phytophthora megakarya]|uniref:CNNM transmembrane domain-containing protein n=1 Tax=Phytophthora megakarya TaxID=4795 RepID=A0A225X133_9STRA|nr:hypothetical protein PHMEG_0002267 [Phytophthora megakarya]